MQSANYDPELTYFAIRFDGNGTESSTSDIVCYGIPSGKITNTFRKKLHSYEEIGYSDKFVKDVLKAIGAKPCDFYSQKTKLTYPGKISFDSLRKKTVGVGFYNLLGLNNPSCGLPARINFGETTDVEFYNNNKKEDSTIELDTVYQSLSKNVEDTATRNEINNIMLLFNHNNELLMFLESPQSHIAYPDLPNNHSVMFLKNNK